MDRDGLKERPLGLKKQSKNKENLKAVEDTFDVENDLIVPDFDPDIPFLEQVVELSDLLENDLYPEKNKDEIKAITNTFIYLANEIQLYLQNNHETLEREKILLDIQAKALYYNGLYFDPVNSEPNLEFINTAIDLVYGDVYIDKPNTWIEKARFIKNLFLDSPSFEYSIDEIEYILDELPITWTLAHYILNFSEKHIKPENSEKILPLLYTISDMLGFLTESPNSQQNTNDLFIFIDKLTLLFDKVLQFPICPIQYIKILVVYGGVLEAKYNLTSSDENLKQRFENFYELAKHRYISASKNGLNLESWMDDFFTSTQ